MKKSAIAYVLGVCLSLCFASYGVAQDAPLKIFISADMEGIGGIGTGKMTSSSGKDYAKGRAFMTGEVNAVIEAIFSLGPAEILVNDSHGDMQNLLHEQLPANVQYIQGNTKPLGMVQGLDASFDAAIFIGYHSRAGTEGGFLAHTGSGSVKGLWVNGVEVGEGGMNAYYAGYHGVPVILASGDASFSEQFKALIPTRTVITKTAVGSHVARLLHPEEVQKRLREATVEALEDMANAPVLEPGAPATIQMRFATTTRADILQAIPGMRRIDGYTVAYDAANMDEGYRLIRLMYKYISW